jgi:hypothetical protein
MQTVIDPAAPQAVNDWYSQVGRRVKQMVAYVTRSPSGQLPNLAPLQFVAAQIKSWQRQLTQPHEAERISFDHLKRGEKQGMHIIPMGATACAD